MSFGTWRSMTSRSFSIFLNEDPVAVSATGSCHVTGTPENMAHITLFFDSKCVAHVSVNWLSPIKVRQTFVGGSKKMIVYDDLEPSEKIKVYDKGITLSGPSENAHQFRIGYRAGDMWAPHISAKEALQTEIEHFIDCVRTGSPPISGGMSGLRVVEILEAASRSIADQGRPVTLRAAAPDPCKAGQRRWPDHERPRSALIRQAAATVSQRTPCNVQSSFPRSNDTASLCCSLVTTAVLARLLTPAEFGIYAVVNRGDGGRCRVLSGVRRCQLSDSEGELSRRQMSGPPLRSRLEFRSLIGLALLALSGALSQLFEQEGFERASRSRR